MIDPVATETTRFVLVHSPLVGPLTWEPTAELLRTRRLGVTLPSLAGVLEGGPPYYPKLAARVAESLRGRGDGERLLLVGHSGAGALLPSAAAACGGVVEAVLYVDALLPHPGASWLATAPPPLRERLLALVEDGRLPPWHEWFPPGTLDPLLPDPDLRARFVAELPRVPWGYFEEPAPDVPDQPGRCAYLQLSAAYQAAADEAARRGWPTRRVAADHLAPLTRPALVVEHLLELVERLRASPGGPPG
jgi:hypothetical protein